jgi:arginyl-tRNA synthetase
LDEYISSVVASGPFLNFKVNHGLLRSMVFKSIISKKEEFGTNNSGSGKTAVIDFSSPNIAKPFHAGHLRSTILGNFVKNSLKANGWKTVALNYLGDWGKQFGLLAVGFEKFGSEEQLRIDPIRHLYDVYVKTNVAAKENPEVDEAAREYFKKMEDGDPDAMVLWDRFRSLSIRKYKEIYDRLGIQFDVYSGESLVVKEMNQALNILEEKALTVQNEGAKIIDLKAEKLGVAMIAKSNGTTLYLTRDLGAARSRKDTYNFDASYYVVGSQQDMHFKQLFRILNMMEYDWAKDCHHINFGMVNGMSTRKGNVVFLEDMLDQAKEQMLEVMKRNEVKFKQIQDPENVADLVGLSAIIVQDMGARRVRDYEFSWDRMLTFEGDTGPYLQYAHARMCSIERKSGFATIPPPLEEVDLSLLSEASIGPVLMLLAQYPDLVRNIQSNGFEPCTVTTYLFRLCRALSSVIDTLYVANQPDEIKKARVLFYWAARVTLGNALRLIGLRPLERM